MKCLNVMLLVISLVICAFSSVSEATESSRLRSTKVTLKQLEISNSPQHQQPQGILHEGSVDEGTENDEGDDDGDDNASLKDENEISMKRYLVRDNTTLTELLDHTYITSYDRSEWLFVGILILVLPLVVGFICAYSHRYAFFTSRMSFLSNTKCKHTIASLSYSF